MKQSNFLKGAIVLLITVAMVFSSIAVSANTDELKETNEFETAYQTRAFQDVLLTEGFEGTGLPTGWTSNDYDGDSYNWDCDWIYTPHSGAQSAASASYINDIGALYPDNWLITSAVDLTGYNSIELSYWVAAQDPAWPADHLEVWISTTGNTVPGDFTDQVDDYTETSDVWKERLVDLSAYGGETIYIAFRHCECTDWYWIKIDDVTVTAESVEDTTPPVTTIFLDGEAPTGEPYSDDVTVSFEAEDDVSGVAATYYTLDGGEEQTYTEPFDVSGDGEHTVTYYSVDNADNTEEEQSETFTIEYPPDVVIEIIEIKGGLGVSAVIKNTGTDDATGVDWEIAVEGGILGRIDVAVNGSEDIAAGAEVTVSTGLFFGLGGIEIDVDAGDASESAEGTQIIIFTMVKAE